MVLFILFTSQKFIEKIIKIKRFFLYELKYFTLYNWAVENVCFFIQVLLLSYLTFVEIKRFYKKKKF